MSELKDWAAGRLEAAIQKELDVLRARFLVIEEHLKLSAPAVKPEPESAEVHDATSQG